MQVAKMFPVRKGSHPGKLLDHSPATSISLSKLADESQLGSLTKLLTPAHNNNVNDCNYETWTPELPVEPLNNSCTQQYETTLQYKSFMPLKKRFRQDFENQIVKESPPPVSVETVQNEVPSSEPNMMNLIEETDMTPVLHCPIKIEPASSTDKVIEESQEGRATKFRACKGERYKIFMNSNRRTRNKNNRWDLRQKSMPPDKLALVGEMEIHQRINDLSSLDMEDYDKSQLRNKKPKKINKTKRKKRQLSPTKSTGYTVDNLEYNKNESVNYLDLAIEEKKHIKQEIIVDIKEGINVQRNGDNMLNNKENGLYESDTNQASLMDEIKIEHELKSGNQDMNIDNFENKTGGSVIGSRKRKLRKQNIMRLQPGSTFKDMRVVEDSSVTCDLGTLADVAVSSEQKTPSSKDTS